MRLVVAALSLTLAQVAACAEKKPAAPPRGGPSFVDRFDRIDPKRWYVSDGWTNGGHQGCTWSRERIASVNGRLLLSLAPAAHATGGKTTCAEIRTHAALGYGTYEARLRVATGSGLNSAMFTYSGKPLTSVHDEIDFEFLGKDASKVQLNYFVTGRGGHEAFPDLAFDASARFANYAFEWLPGSIRWYVDGRLVREAKGGMPETPGQFFFSLWNGTGQSEAWLGPYRSSPGPVFVEIDWAAFTRAGERCRFAESITCRAPSAR